MFLGSMPAIQQYSIHPQRAIIHEVPGQNGVRCWGSLNSMADSSTMGSAIMDLISGDCWARCQLRRGIKDISVTPKPLKSLGLVRVVLIDTLAIIEGGSRFLHACFSDPGYGCGRLLGSTPATQRYKGRLCRTKTLEIAHTCGCCFYRYPHDPRTRW